MSKDVLETISCAGLNGIKKAELKKTLGKNCDNILQNLADEEKIVIEKKGTPYFIWTVNNYTSYLSQKDPKFKIILNSITKKEPSDTKINSKETGKPILQQATFKHDDDFKVEFDLRLAESSTSIGWAPFVEIRKKICVDNNISVENFYSMATALVEKHRGKYEVSSGGQEGIMARGLVHGYVRNI